MIKICVGLLANPYCSDGEESITSSIRSAVSTGTVKFNVRVRYILLYVAMEVVQERKKGRRCGKGKRGKSSKMCG